MHKIIELAVKHANEIQYAKYAKKQAGARIDAAINALKNFANNENVQKAGKSLGYGGLAGGLTYGASRALGYSKGRSLGNAGIVGGSVAAGTAGYQYKDKLKSMYEGLKEKMNKKGAPSAQTQQKPATQATKPNTPPVQAPKAPENTDDQAFNDQLLDFSQNLMSNPDKLKGQDRAIASEIGDYANILLANGKLSPEQKSRAQTIMSNMPQ